MAYPASAYAMGGSISATESAPMQMSQTVAGAAVEMNERLEHLEKTIVEMESRLRVVTRQSPMAVPSDPHKSPAMHSELLSQMHGQARRLAEMTERLNWLLHNVDV